MSIIASWASFLLIRAIDALVEADNGVRGRWLELNLAARGRSMAFLHTVYFVLFLACSWATRHRRLDVIVKLWRLIAHNLLGPSQAIDDLVVFHDQCLSALLLFALEIRQILVKVLLIVSTVELMV